MFVTIMILAVGLFTACAYMLDAAKGETSADRMLSILFAGGVLCFIFALLEIRVRRLRQLCYEIKYLKDGEHDDRMGDKTSELA